MDWRDIKDYALLTLAGTVATIILIVCFNFGQANERHYRETHSATTSTAVSVPVSLIPPKVCQKISGNVVCN
jgi:hypothetical protein